MTNPIRLSIDYLEDRRAVVQADLEAFQQSKHPGRERDAAALKNYVGWLDGLIARAQAGKTAVVAGRKLA
jgi:hypothetical protein